MSLKELNNKIKKLEKEINELKEENKKLKKENNDYKYKYYENSLCGVEHIYGILDEDEIYNNFVNNIKDKILKTNNNIYKKYNITIENLIDLFLDKFCNYKILDLLHNNDDINDFIENYHNILSVISANNYMSCQGADSFNDKKNNRIEIINYLIDYFNITFEDIDEIVLKKYIKTIINDYMLSKNINIRIRCNEHKLFDNIINYINKHNINIKEININSLENKVKKLIDDYLNEVKKF